MTFTRHDGRYWPKSLDQSRVRLLFRPYFSINENVRLASGLSFSVYVYFVRLTWAVVSVLLLGAFTTTKSHLCIPFLGIGQPQCQFPH